MNDTGAKQQIVEKIKSSNNILVTVSSNPSVDELSAALGLTLLLNKTKKHATAVFSGAIPPAITFLDPEKTFENTVDSLRDFIIALDKEKADHLRYKVDGDVVKIFITPYRTTITGDDLEFSQGDYNVEMVLALGVKDQGDLDSALSAHGRILHDATVATIGVGDDRSELGSIDWHVQNASSLSEMVVGIADALKSDKPLLDEQVATAFLTGIVAATDRFSNSNTTSKAMNVAAQLMTAGANQQLIASKLEEAHEIGDDKRESEQNSDGTTNMSEGQSTKLEKRNQNRRKKDKPEKPKDDGSLTISHEKQGNLDDVSRQTQADEQQQATVAAEEQLQKRSKEVATKRQDDAAKQAEQNLAEQLASVAPAAAAATPSVAELQKDLADASADIDEASEQTPPTVQPLANPIDASQWQNNDQPPVMGGTLNATTEQAADDKRRAIEDDRNRTILSHGNGNNYVGGQTPTFQSPLNATAQPSDEPPSVDPFKDTNTFQPDTAPTVYAAPLQPSATTLADLDKQNRTPHDDARAAVEAALGTVSQPSFESPTSVPEQPSVPVASAEPSFQAQSQSLPPLATELPPLPPLPDFSTLPPLPPQSLNMNEQPNGPLSPERLEDMFGAPSPQPATPPQPIDPKQFKILGQS